MADGQLQLPFKGGIRQQKTVECDENGLAAYHFIFMGRGAGEVASKWINAEKNFHGFSLLSRTRFNSGSDTVVFLKVLLPPSDIRAAEDALPKDAVCYWEPCTHKANEVSCLSCNADGLYSI